MILSARYIKKPRRLRMCDHCGHWLDRGCIYVYGGSRDIFPKPIAGRYCPCVECVGGRDEPKIQAALKQAEGATNGNG
jgi:hypothetical protein